MNVTVKVQWRSQEAPLRTFPEKKKKKTSLEGGYNSWSAEKLRKKRFFSERICILCFPDFRDNNVCVIQKLSILLFGIKTLYYLSSRLEMKIFKIKYFQHPKLVCLSCRRSWHSNSHQQFTQLQDFVSMINKFLELKKSWAAKSRHYGLNIGHETILVQWSILCRVRTSTLNEMFST